MGTHEDISPILICHSGLDPESSVFLDSCWSLPRTPYGAGMTFFGDININMRSHLPAVLDKKDEIKN
jgi:hypothetical protein